MDCSGIAWHALRKQKAPAVVLDNNQKDDSVDWEWSSLAAALPIYTSQDAALTGTNTIPESTSHDGQQPTPTPQHHLAQHFTGAAAAAQHTLSTPSEMGGGDGKAKINSQGKPGEKASSEYLRPPQHGVGSLAMSAADIGRGGRPLASNKGPVSAVLPVSIQHRTPVVRVTTAHERTAAGSPTASGPKKAAGMPMSPQHDGHKPAAGTAHAAQHHRSGSPRVPMRTPSRKGDFLSQSSGQAVYPGSGSRDERTDQAAAIMMLNQLVADAHTYGAS